MHLRAMHGRSAGYRSADISIAPEPSGLALGCAALACVGGVAEWRHRAFPEEPR
jgi:hypothetical protein